MKGKQIKGYPKYSITETGEVWSYNRKKPFKLKPQSATQNKKYLQVRLYNDERRPSGSKKGVLHYVHRLVYEHYVGEIPNKRTIDHKDEDTSNNHYSNLQVMTQSDNSSKSNSKRMKLVDKKDEIRELYKQGITQSKLAEMYNCSPPHIWRIINRKRQTRRNGKWIYLPMED